MPSLRTETLTKFMDFVTQFFDPSYLFFILISVTLILVYKFLGLKRVIFFSATLLVGILSVLAIKYLLNVTRPTDALVPAFSPSFPSAHSAIATIFFIMLMHHFDGLIRGTWRKIFNFFCISSLFLVAISRVYLGVHWVSDVFGGILLGVLVSYLAVLILNHRKN